MASAEGSEGCATLNWEIKNFDLLLETDPVMKNGNLTSPVLKVEHNEGNMWCVFCVCHRNRCIWFDRRRVREVAVNVRCDVSIISSCGEVPLKKDNNNSFYIEKDTVFDNRNQSMLPNNSLTFRWRIRGANMKNQELRVCSVLHSEKYLWNIQRFHFLSSYKTYVEQDNFLIYVSLNEKRKEGTPMVVEIIPNAEIFISIVNCTLSTTDGCELIKNGTCIFPGVKWTCNVEKFPDIKEMMDIQFRWIISFHKIVKPENASKAVSGPPSARADDLLLLYREGTLSDATLNTEGKSFSAHRSILAARSPVFRAMFEKDETSEGRSGVVDIDDVDSETVDRMLVFLYGEKLDDVQWEDALALYYAADKYDVFSLKQRCVDILKAGLTVTNACDVLVLSDTHSDEQLRKCVVDFICDHREVFSSSKWEKLEESNPRLTTKIFREVYVKKGKVVSEDECEIHIVTHKNKPFRVSVNNVKHEFTNGLFQEIYFLLTFIPVLSLIGAPIGALFS